MSAKVCSTRWHDGRETRCGHRGGDSRNCRSKKRLERERERGREWKRDGEGRRKKKETRVTTESASFMFIRHASLPTRLTANAVFLSRSRNTDRPGVVFVPPPCFYIVSIHRGNRVPIVCRISNITAKIDYQFIQLLDFFREKFLGETQIVVNTVVSLQRYTRCYKVEWNVDITRNTRAPAFREKTTNVKLNTEPFRRKLLSFDRNQRFRIPSTPSKDIDLSTP